MKIERAEGGALVLRWNAASWSKLGVSAAIAAFVLATAAAFLPWELAPAVTLGSLAAAAAGAVVLAHAASDATWRVERGSLVRPRGWLRPERRWSLDGDVEVRLTMRVVPGRNAHEKWGVALTSGDEEVQLGERANAEGDARRIGEVLAKELRASLRYAPGERPFRPEDLDLPFVERVAKYPELRVEPSPRPERSPIQDEMLGSSRVFRWRALNLYTLAAAVGLPLFGLVYVASESRTMTRWLIANPEWVGAVILVPVALLAGLGFRLSAGPPGVEFQTTFYGLPLRTKAIAASELEDARPRKVVHTPALQLVSDREIIRCKVYRWKGDDLLRWLAGEVQQALAGSLGSAGRGFG